MSMTHQRAKLNNFSPTHYWTSRSVMTSEYLPLKLDMTVFRGPTIWVVHWVNAEV
jgi:hypothetical protein